MSETFAEQVSRVRLMASGDETWDLTPNDIAALKAVLAERDHARETAAELLCRGYGEGQERAIRDVNAGLLDDAIAPRLNALRAVAPPLTAGPVAPPQPEESLVNPVSQVYFRAGLLACREYMARFVEAQDPTIANSIRANWWPALGQDFGPPRKLAWSEVTSGEYGTPDFSVNGADTLTATQEALPVALAFLESGRGEAPRGAARPPQPPEPQGAFPVGCIGCGHHVVVGYTIQREPGPFCHDCWSALKVHVAQVNLLNHHVDAADRDVDLAARPPASPPALEALLAKWCACRDDDTFESWHERDAFAKQIREALAVPPEAPPR